MMADEESAGRSASDKLEPEDTTNGEKQCEYAHSVGAARHPPRSIPSLYLCIWRAR